ncbi:MAG TPA: glycosyltransferase family 4 protein [Gemmatimonadaceae bacterium]|nr:glycosyltransferase family 4 protein [Gemmatimonadaceae bacterium]
MTTTSTSVAGEADVMAASLESSARRARVSRPLRVCVVAPSLDILGGQAVVAQRLIERLRTDPSLEVSFIPHNPRLPGPLRSLQRIKYVRTAVTSVAYLALLLRKLRDVDVVHVFSASYFSFILAPTPAVLVGRLYGKRVILNYRSGEAFDHLSKWPRSSLPIFRRADLIVVPSGFLVDVFAKFGLRATAVPNFVEVDAMPYRRRAALRPRFLTNRNFAPHYNVGCVLRAFARIQASIPEAQLTVAGDGQQGRQLHALARELELRNVEFVGQIPPREMAALYDQADAYLNSPNVDNMPNSVVEAFAAGLPVVTTRAGGIPYIVSHEENGLLVDCDDHQALAAAALRLFSEPDLALRLADRARSDVLSKYTWSAVRNGWRRAYGLTDEPAGS